MGNISTIRKPGAELHGGMSLHAPGGNQSNLTNKNYKYMSPYAKNINKKNTFEVWIFSLVIHEIYIIILISMVCPDDMFLFILSIMTFMILVIDILMLENEFEEYFMI